MHSVSELKYHPREGVPRRRPPPPRWPANFLLTFFSFFREFRKKLSLLLDFSRVGSDLPINCGIWRPFFVKGHLPPSFFGDAPQFPGEIGVRTPVLTLRDPKIGSGGSKTGVRPPKSGSNPRFRPPGPQNLGSGGRKWGLDPVLGVETPDFDPLDPENGVRGSKMGVRTPFSGGIPPKSGPKPPFRGFPGLFP